ncbi:hypothetical protein LPJ72_005623, partial [Coemansia sp. Benny D160-2]
TKQGPSRRKAAAQAHLLACSLTRCRCGLRSRRTAAMASRGPSLFRWATRACKDMWMISTTCAPQSLSRPSCLRWKTTLIGRRRRRRRAKNA